MPPAPARSVQTSTRCGRSQSRRSQGRARATQSRDGAEAPEQFKEGRHPRSACPEPTPYTVQPTPVRNERIGHREQFGRRLPRSQAGVPMRYMVGAEQLQQVPSLAHRPDGVFRVARTAPVGPTHAVCAVTRRHRMWDQGRRPRGAERGLGSGLLCREVRRLFRHRSRSRERVAAQRYRRASATEWPGARATEFLAFALAGRSWRSASGSGHVQWWAPARTSRSRPR